MNPYSRAALLLLALLTAACTPDGTRPTTAGGPEPAFSTDAQGRVVRPRTERNWDDALEHRVKSALTAADAAAYRGVATRAWDGGILLTGAVDKPSRRRTAVEIARGIDGVAQVFDDLVLAENPADPVFVPDTNLEQRIYAGLLGQDSITGAYEVRVVKGVAYLQGSARSREDVERAADFVRGFGDVKWVVDHVSVR